MKVVQRKDPLAYQQSVVRVEFHRPPFLLSRAPLLGMQRTVMSLIFWYAKKTHEEPGLSCSTHGSTLSGEDERKTKIWIGLVHFHPCGITMLSYLRSASLEIIHGSDEHEEKSRRQKCLFRDRHF